ncbi:hypothetical protein C8R46DRAFT_1190648 [Mycena filopes]|nr:hypothetical protein C8R46DRAFT_1190648 [Mycena filopes]
MVSIDHFCSPTKKGAQPILKVLDSVERHVGPSRCRNFTPGQSGRTNATEYLTMLPPVLPTGLPVADSFSVLLPEVRSWWIDGDAVCACRPRPPNPRRRISDAACKTTVTRIVSIRDCAFGSDDVPGDASAQPPRLANEPSRRGVPPSWRWSLCAADQRARGGGCEGPQPSVGGAWKCSTGDTRVRAGRSSRRCTIDGLDEVGARVPAAAFLRGLPEGGGAGDGGVVRLDVDLHSAATYGAASTAR